MNFLILLSAICFANPVFIEEDPRVPSFSDTKDFTEVTFQSGTDYSLDIESTYKEYRNKFFGFLEKKKITKQYNCWEDVTLDIYHVEQNELNKIKPAEFKDVFLWGLYEPAKSKKDSFKIFFSSPDNDDSSAHIVLAHELFHFWFQKYCIFLEVSKKGEDEELAQKFEKFISKE